MSLIRRSITLMELPSGGWLWKEQDRTYKSAATALRAVRRAAMHDVLQAGGIVTTVLTWEPCSYVGTLAVQAITAE
jgi:hypothetical protein